MMRVPKPLIEGARRDRIPDDPLEFLASLEGPSVWRVGGRDSSRVRMVTTLLHGNEPSGFLAVHDWLRSGEYPATDVVFVVAHVEAARLNPVFTHRRAPKRRDLNRCFLGPFEDVEGEIARAILEVVRDVRPEALIDVHNNTGHNPAYGVGVEPTPEALWLTALFGRDFVWSHLQLGALLEAVEDCPAVTVEVGKSHAAEADRVAREGLSRFLNAETLFDANAQAAPVRVLLMPMRARMAPGCTLVMAQQPDAQADLTMPDDLDRHNFETVDVGARVGWVRGEACPLQLLDEDGTDRAPDYFEHRNGELVARRPFMPIMITVDAAIAASDCLFYVVHEVGDEPD
jgi:hypothetical protein